MENLAKYWQLGLVVLGMLNSCADDQDFNQFDNLNITPTVEGSILYVDTPEQLINLANGIDFFSQEFNFDACSEAFISERVLEGVIIYEVENTTSKALEVSFEFLDEAGNVLDTENFDINAAPTSILRREINYGGASGRNLDIIRNTSSIRVSARNLGDNTSVSNLPDPRVVLRSSAQLTIRLK